MGNFDAAAVIQAAATSNLGVVSLLVLVLAFLAWRFFQRSEDRTKLIAFAMMFLGAAGFVASVLVAGGDTGDDAVEREATATAASETGFAPAPSEDRVDIAGTWRDPEGYRYVFTRPGGDAFLYTVFLEGEQVGTGAGAISGRRLTYHFIDSANGNEGDCEAELAVDGQTISGKCDDGSAAWSFAIRR